MCKIAITIFHEPEHSMARANLNKSENFVTNTIAASKYIPNVKVAHQFVICICFDFFNCACLKKTITNIRYLEFDTSKSMSYQGHKRPRICINWNPSFKPKIYVLKGQLPRWILWNKIYLMKTVFKNLMKRGILMNPILIDADSGPLVFVSKFLLLFRLALAILWKSSLAIA